MNYANRNGRCSISVTSCPMPIRLRATFEPALPPPATSAYTYVRASAGSRAPGTSQARTASVRTSIAVFVGDTVRRPSDW